MSQSPKEKVESALRRKMDTREEWEIFVFGTKAVHNFFSEELRKAISESPFSEEYKQSVEIKVAESKAILWADSRLRELEADLPAALRERDEARGQLCRPCPHAKRVSDACKLLDAALGDGPECDCPPEGHICGWPKWKQETRSFLDAERRRSGGKP
jgi:hypothetical protein